MPAVKYSPEEFETFLKTLSNQELYAHVPLAITRSTWYDGMVVHELWDRYVRTSRRLKAAEEFILNLPDWYLNRLLDEHLNYRDHEDAPGEDPAF